MPRSPRQACAASLKVRSRTGGWLSFPRADPPARRSRTQPSGASEAGETGVPADALVRSPPPAPPQAVQIFGPATAAAERYPPLLAGPGGARGLLRAGGGSRPWGRALRD